MDDLVAFLHARLDDDEQAARAAHAPNWSTDGRRGLHYGVDDGWMTDALTTADADHIARHDPARVLREVEAKRRLLNTYAPEAAKTDEQVNEEWGYGSTLADDLLRLLALPYADHPDHPDYRPRWDP